jgi:plastocyanin
MRRLMGIGLTAVLAAGVAGCGDSGGGSSSGTGTATGDSAKPPVTLNGSTNQHASTDVSGKGANAEVELEADDFYFSPTFVKAAAGQAVKVNIANQGKATHTFTVAGSVDEQLAPGAKKTVTVTAPANGVLVYFCRFHQSRGMQGALYLHAGDAQSSSGSGSSPGSSPSSTPTSGGGYGY